MTRKNDHKYLVRECNGLIISTTQKLTQAERKLLTHLLGSILKNEIKEGISKRLLIPIDLSFDDYKHISKMEPVTEMSEITSLTDLMKKRILVEYAKKPNQLFADIPWVHKVEPYTEDCKLEIVFSRPLVIHARLFYKVLADEIDSQNFCY